MCVKPLSGCVKVPEMFPVQVYHSLFWPLEFTVPNRDNNKCYSKIICNKLDSVSFITRDYICSTCGVHVALPHTLLLSFR